MYEVIYYNYEVVMELAYTFKKKKKSGDPIASLMSDSDVINNAAFCLKSKFNAYHVYLSTTVLRSCFDQSGVTLSTFLNHVAH